MKFKTFLENIALEEPQVVTVNPPANLPSILRDLALAFDEAKDLIIAKQVDPKGGTKPITLKTKHLYLVGEPVANILLNRSIGEAILVTDAHPDEIKRIAKQNNFIYENGKIEDYYIETMRDGDVYTTEPQLDSKSKSLSLDGLYYEIKNDKVIDPVGGLSDLRRKTVTFINNPEKEFEKHTDLIFRYCRWISGFNKIIDNNIVKDFREALVQINKKDFWINLNNPYTNIPIYLQNLEILGVLKDLFGRLIVSSYRPELNPGEIPETIMASILIDNEPSEIYYTLRKLGYNEIESKGTAQLIELLNNKKIDPRGTNINKQIAERFLKAYGFVNDNLDLIFKSNIY